MDRIVRTEERRSRARTPGTSTLPPDLLAEGVRRLGSLSLFTAILMAVTGATLYTILHGPGSPLKLPAFVVWCAVGRVLVALGMFALTRRKDIAPALVLDRGLLFLVLMGFLLAVPYHALPRPDVAFPRGFSAVAVWLIAYPLIVPSTRGKAVLAILATAFMDPLGLLVNLSLGGPRPSQGELIELFLPTVLTTAIAIAGSRIVYRLSVEAARGREMGSYRLLSPLGRGGMGEVWRAEHRMLARPAAVKLVHQEKVEGFSGREMKARFEREARVTAALRSPHTVQLYDYGETDDGSFFYAMELLEGLPLDVLVERFGPQPAARVVHILRQACRSLEEAHRAGLVHRDVKPSNLFLCRLGVEADFVKVLDFGLVKAVAPDEPSLTATGVVTGTPAYLPPEMARGSADVDGRADLYSLACVGYFLMSGVPVFERPTPLATIHAHAAEAPPPLSARTEQNVPPALEGLLLACLAKDPASRPASAFALERALAEIARDFPWSEDSAGEWWARRAAPTSALPVEATRR